MLACEEVESVLIVSGSLDNKIALRLSKGDNGLEQRAFALLYVLAERVENIAEAGKIPLCSLPSLSPKSCLNHSHIMV